MTRKITKSIDINSTKERVWSVLTTDEHTKVWFTAFGEGIITETDWTLGSKAKFTDSTGNGIVGRIVKNEPPTLLSIEYDGVVTNGVEDYTSKDAEAVKGSHETYTLSGNSGITTLHIECDMDENYFDMMSVAWDKALDIIKELSTTEA